MITFILEKSRIKNTFIPEIRMRKNTFIPSNKQAKTTFFPKNNDEDTFLRYFLYRGLQKYHYLLRCIHALQAPSILFKASCNQTVTSSRPSAVWISSFAPAGTSAAERIAWPLRRVMEKPRLRMLSGCAIWMVRSR